MWLKLNGCSRWFFNTKCHIFSAISRAVLKLVYLFGIPNSNPQMLKSVDFWCKLSSTFLVAEPREWCFELFRMQNSQTFPGFCPWTPLGRAYSIVPDSPAVQQFFSSLHLSKNQHPQKIAGYSIDIFLFLRLNLTNCIILQTDLKDTVCQHVFFNSYRWSNEVISNNQYLISTLKIVY